MSDFNSLYSVTGFGTLIATTISGSTRIITTEAFQPELMLNVIEKYKVCPQALNTTLLVPYNF